MATVKFIAKKVADVVKGFTPPKTGIEHLAKVKALPLAGHTLTMSIPNVMTVDWRITATHHRIDSTAPDKPIHQIEITIEPS